MSKRVKAKRGRISCIPVMEVDNRNLNQVWPILLLSIKTSDFIALDLEFSGLSESKMRNNKSVEERYVGGKLAAESRTIFSIGVSTFKLLKNERGTKRVKMEANVYNIFTMSQTDFSCEPGSMAYLSRNNFDFARAFLHGVPYKRISSSSFNPENQETHKKSSPNPLQTLVEEILESRKPIIFHNGLLDLIFLYGNFVTQLPETSGKFLADLTNLLEDGFILDSKCLVEFDIRLPASYLEYIFRYCQRCNAKECDGKRIYLSLVFPMEVCNIGLGNGESDDGCVKTLNIALPKTPSNSTVEEKSLCISMANHGYCTKNESCLKSHDLDEILDVKDQKREKKRLKNRKRKRSLSTSEQIQPSPSTSTPNQTQVLTSPPDVANERERVEPSNVECCIRPGMAGTNRAAFDAFMAGFSFAFGSRVSLHKDGTLPEDYKNCIYLSGKPFPLRIQNSNFLSSL